MSLAEQIPPQIPDPRDQSYEWMDPKGADRFGGLTLSGLLNDISTNDPVIKDTIARNSLNVIVGPANVGKSAVATAAALSISKQLPFLDRAHVWPYPPGKTAILAGEAVENVRGQVIAWDKHHGELLIDDDLIVVPRTLDLSDHQVAARLGDWLGEEMVGVVVIDPLINFIGRSDENDSSQIAAVMRGIRLIADRLCSPYVVLLVHHANQSGGIRGSRVIRDLADVVYLASADGPNRVKLKRDKNRFGPVDDLLYADLKVVRDDAWNIESVVAAPVRSSLRAAACLTVSQTKAWDILETQIETTGATKADLAQLLTKAGIPRAGAYRAIDALVTAGKLRVFTSSGASFYAAVKPAAN